MVVARDRISVSMLAWVGSRWRIKTNAMPVSVGRAWTIWLKASRPPAEAPMPTMGNCAPGVLGDSGATCTGSEGRAGELLGGPAEPEAPLDGSGRLPADFFRATTTSSLPWGRPQCRAVINRKQVQSRPPEPMARAVLTARAGSERSGVGFALQEASAIRERG